LQLQDAIAVQIAAVLGVLRKSPTPISLQANSKVATLFNIHRSFERFENYPRDDVYRFNIRGSKVSYICLLRRDIVIASHRNMKDSKKQKLPKRTSDRGASHWLRAEKSPHLINMDGLWELRSISKFIARKSCWEMGSRRYSGFLRYDLRVATVSVFFSPRDKVNHITIFTEQYKLGMSSLAQVQNSAS